jgi:hypothetical protein
MHTGFWRKSLKIGDQLQELCEDGRIVLEWILKKRDGRAWAGFIWLGTETTDELL